MYVNWGEGQSDVFMIGLSPYDNNAQINAYKAQMGISNSCAGIEGNSSAAIQTVIDGQQFFGYPTYCVVCPDVKLNFNVCFPPTSECFDTYIENCGATATEEVEDVISNFSIYPNPATADFYVEFPEGKICGLKIFDIMGSLVREIKYSSESGIVNVKVGDLPSGIYQLSLETENGLFSKKLMIR